MDHTQIYESPLGAITLCSDGKALTGLYFAGQNYDRKALSLECEEKDPAIFSETAAWLDSYFKGEIPDFTPALSVECSPFRSEVLEILKQIPYGETITYGDIAKHIAKKRGITRMSAQAVGGAVGWNPVSIIIPCHRVIGAKGNLTGYGGGMDRKIFLLKLEKVDMDAMFIPKNSLRPKP